MTNEAQDEKRKSDAVHVAVLGERLDNTIENISKLENEDSQLHKRVDELGKRMNKQEDKFVSKSKFIWMERVFYGAIMAAIATAIGYFSGKT